MFVNSKKFIAIVAVPMLLYTGITSATTSERPLKRTCDGDDCSMPLDSKVKAYRQLCSTSAVAFWNLRRPDYYIVQCDCNCTMQANTIWFIDKRSKKVYGFSAGRFVSKSFIENATAETTVPDRFSSVKLCKAPVSEFLKSSIFVLLHKRPDDIASPYCYEVTSIIQRDDDILLSWDNGQIPMDNKDYWLPVIPQWQRSVLFSVGNNVN